MAAAAPRAKSQRLRWHLKLSGQREEAAAARAARLDLLLPEEPGFLEADPGEDTCTITQGDIAEAVDIASAAKHFDLRLEQFGPYRLDYTRNGRHLLLGGRRGHVAAMDWQTKALMCEINVMETVTDVAWLHTETLLAVAQRRWLHVYDNQGLELNCLKSFPGVLQLQFLPYHFLLATAHSNGTVTLWSPTVSEPLVRMLCHRGALRALVVDPTGTYMASAGLDRKLRLFDLRTYRVLQELVLPQGAGHLAFSQRGVLAAACGDLVQVYKGVGKEVPPQPYLCHRPPRPPHGLRFCPFEDVLGAGHSHGFTSILVPGAGEANFDALENNPYRSRRQRQEWEVKALLEKGFDPQAKAKFKPRRRAKGNNLLHRKRKVAHEEQRAVIRQSVEQREQEKKGKRKERRRGESSLPPKRGALDRFKK
ncbi:PREDICTED: WD repeat-containing protein 46 [Haliaeetus leucocephalus]|uniref:WD repeat-containing protein 46 n=1 Tax=Haliaeetus leucocephalus TaxID=52644 RepID=UPI00053CAFA9|nr:PREDICTED: WD repeat-containing protein 46 [Haliaeetus leucocephalus]